MRFYGGWKMIDELTIAAFVMEGRLYWEASDRFGLREHEIREICDRHCVVPTYGARATIQQLFIAARLKSGAQSSEMLSGTRTLRASIARMLFVDGCRRYRPLMSYPDIAHALSRRVHSTIYDQVKRMDEMPDREQLRRDYDNIIVTAPECIVIRQELKSEKFVAAADSQNGLITDSEKRKRF